MGRRGGWFSAVKKVLISDSKKDQKSHTLKTKWFGNGKHTDLEPALSSEDAQVAVAPPFLPIEDIKLTEAENERSKHAYSVALATAVAAAKAAAEVVRLTSMPYYPGKTKEEIAAIKIQTAFRGYLARRALRALRGLVRLKKFIQGHSVKRQAATTLRCMQTLARVQSQIREGRTRMSEENQALRWQLQQKHDEEFYKLQAGKVGEEWDDSMKSKEQIEARLLNRLEAAMRRERALAYAFTHQQTWRNSSKSANTMFMDNNPYWGWSWLERWMASQPWQSRSTMDHSDHASLKSAASHAMSVEEITKLYSLPGVNQDSNPSPAGQKSSQPPRHHSPLFLPLKGPSLSSTTWKSRGPSPKGNATGGDDDSRSMFSIQSERYRRHSIAGSSIGDYSSITSSPAFPNYMTLTKSAKARSRTQSPSGVDKYGTPEKGSAVSARKRLSFPFSPAGSRRHSDPPKVGILSKMDVATVTGDKITN